jgi:hypothetical protein
MNSELGGAGLGYLKELIHLLENHTRKEDRELIPKLSKLISESELED